MIIYIQSAKVICILRQRDQREISPKLNSSKKLIPRFLKNKILILFGEKMGAIEESDVTKSIYSILIEKGC